MTSETRFDVEPRVVLFRMFYPMEWRKPLSARFGCPDEKTWWADSEWYVQGHGFTQSGAFPTNYAIRAVIHDA